MFRKKDKKLSSSTPLDVVVIGCGPAGMSFLHAYNKRKKESPNPSSFPNITCYERAPCVGGLWRDLPSDDLNRTKPENKAVMYDDMWANQPKMLMEYFDYTFDDHFRKATPNHLPRKEMLDYIVARNSVDGALDDVKLSHSVLRVSYDSGLSKFNVSVRNDETGEAFTKKFDKCVWAAGLHGYLEDPDDIDELLEEFTGKVIHSSEATENFATDVKGKKVVLIGDGNSAEDLALRALKLGAKKIYIASRSGQGDASEMGCWPGDKIEMIEGPPYKVLKGNHLKFHIVYWSDKKQKWRRDDDEEPVKIKDIDICILCTGYNPSSTFLDKDIQFDEDQEWQTSKGWIMDNNALTISVGNVAPSKYLTPGGTVHPQIYDGIFITNPSMMYILENEEPLSSIIDVEVKAWLVLSYLIGENEVPKEKDMLKSNQKRLEAEMQIPWLRAGMDRSYLAELYDLDDDHWVENAEDERSVRMDTQASEHVVNCLARQMKDAHYPVDIGKPGKLNDKGKKLVVMSLASGKARTSLKANSPDAKWKTFFDYEDAAFQSIFTGTPSTSLPGRFIEMKAPNGEHLKLSNVITK